MPFRNSLLKIDQPTPKPVYNTHNTTGLKLLARLRLRLSHLNGHKFKYNFRDSVNPLCSCSLEVVWRLSLLPFFFFFFSALPSLHRYPENPLS